MAKNNYARFKQEADIETVVNYLGIKVTRKGSAYFVLCPLPEHEDRHATNCYFKSGWNNLYCTACGRSINAIDLIIYTLGVSYGQAADLLWELEGRPDWYYTYKTKKGKEVFQLTRKEASVIGIHSPGYVLTPIQLSVDKPEHDRNVILRYDENGYLLCKVTHLTWQDFMSEEEYRNLIKRKAIERGKNAQKLMLHCNNYNPAQKPFQKAFLEIAKECKAISERA